MPKIDPIQQALERLADLRAAPDDASLHDELRSFLRSRSNLVIAKAAKIAGERRITPVVPDLVTAFQKLMADPARLDKRCEATTEIISALYELDRDVYFSRAADASFGTTTVSRPAALLCPRR